MILAIAALVLHFPAVPQSSLSATRRLSREASAISQPTGQPAAASTAAGDAAPAPPSAAIPEAAGSSDAELQPSERCRVSARSADAQPVVASAAATKTGAFPPSPGAAAFLASTPAALNARREEQSRKHLWLALSIAQSGAATFDAWSTRRVVSRGGQELNPMLRPFAGNASIYAAVQVTPLLLDYVSHRMMTSEHSWARHTWWMPQAIGTAMSIAGGAYNLSGH